MEYNGKHMMVDSRVTAPLGGQALLNEPEACIRLMEMLVESIDMTMILPPVTVKFPHAYGEMDRVLQKLHDEGLGESKVATELKSHLTERRNGTYGYSTFVIIAESHLSIHTFPEEGFYTFDCYSCKDFDNGLIESVLREFFGEQKMNVVVVERMIPNL